MRKKGMLIAIDGTAGTGKSSAGKLVAEKLGYSFLSTGEMYRALGYKTLQLGVDMTDDAAVTEIAKKMKFTFERQPDASLKMFVDGEYLGAKLHEEATGQAASKTSALKNARAVLTEKQREVGREGGVVMEGRDIGTVVFPDAEVKFYIDASARERANRRYKQLTDRGESADFNAILKGIEERDHRDSSRAVAPLKAAADAVVLDTSDMNLQQVTAKLLEIIAERKNNL
ncbi:cytidylate kinase [Elusimicrobium simillimum]|uniref:(d)CMP kinase n=1 Tax=Elusimicrobium simillimum TaxID=3143438 RepID=UPI003C6F2F25